MTADDYRQAIQAADADAVTLPRHDGSAPPTPWDPGLRVAFQQRRSVVHEERLLDELLAP
jgi:hypothetical protein